MKNTLKKSVALLLAVTMLFCLTACKGSKDTSSNGGSSVVVGNSSTESTDTVTSEQPTESETSSEDTSSNNTTSTGTPSRNNSSNENPSKVTTSANTSSKNNTQPVNYEKPYEGNSAILAGGQTSKYDSQAETLRKKIVNAKDKTFKGAATYYISYKGSDDNTGTSKDQAWKTITKLRSVMATLPEGAVILFERGGVYRGKIYASKGVTLAAYGTGSKPAIYGSTKNYGDESLWKKTDTPNVWMAETIAEGSVVGLIVFDHGKKTTERKIRLERLKNDYEMFSAGDKTYVYLSKGNPGKIHKDIEMCGNGSSIQVITAKPGIKNVTIDNLCVKYGGIHGIQFTNSQNITITNCEIGYIGGGTSSGYGGSWLGNGIEFWESCKNVLVDNCWVYQCYDAGITNQGRACTQENITFSNNLVEYCNYNIEYFIDQTGSAKMKDVIYTDNILRFAGSGCFRPENRGGDASDNSPVSLICGWGSGGRTYACENFVIKNNILDTSYRYLVSITEPNTARNAKLQGNTYYQKASSTAAICITGKNTTVMAQNATQFKEEVAKFDSTAKAVDFAS